MTKIRPFPTLSSGRRGGSFFTMIIFIMMLISTALMYYYFQRSRSLEREIASIKTGDPGHDSSGFFGMMPWSSKASAPTGDSAITPGAASPRPATSPVVPSPESQLAGAPAEGVVMNAEAPVQDSTSSGSLNLASEDLLPAESQDPAATVSGTAEEVQEPEMLPESEVMPEQAGTDGPAQGAPPVADEGQSLYNLQSAPVRVRAPRRQ